MAHRIRVRHPGYEAPNVLFTLPTSDGTHRSHAHYATIWIACSIFIDNRRDHWLSSSTSGEAKVTADADGLIRAGDYFLYVPADDTGATYPFPIVPNFRAWRYPHSSIPSLWTEASQNDIARHTSFSSESISVERCRITNRKLEVDNAHVIPVTEKLWFIINEMEEYGDLFGRSGEIIVDSSANLLRLRCDAHRLWDKLNFSIVPRKDSTTAEGGAAWFTQALGDDEELQQHWHHKKLEPLAGRPPQYLLARFAWDIFPKLHSFLQAGQERQLKVWTFDGRAETRWFSGPECREFTTGQGQNRSASPTKRARSKSSNLPQDRLEEAEDGSRTPDSGDSAVAGFHRSHKNGNISVRAGADRGWHRYVCGHDDSDERRGRQRLRH